MAKKIIMTVFGIQIEESMLQPTIAEMMKKEHFTASVFEETLRKNHTFVEHVIRESKISFDHAIMRIVDRTIQMLRKEGSIAFNKEHREWMVLRSKNWRKPDAITHQD